MDSPQFLAERDMYMLLAEAWGVEIPEVPDDGAIDQAFAAAAEEFEAERLERIMAGSEHQCAGCGCSESRPCPGGCVWATSAVCSRCV